MRSGEVFVLVLVSTPQRAKPPLTRGGGICKANDGEVVKWLMFKPLSHGFRRDSSPFIRGAFIGPYKDSMKIHRIAR